MSAGVHTACCAKIKGNRDTVIMDSIHYECRANSLFALQEAVQNKTNSLYLLLENVIYSNLTKGFNNAYNSTVYCFN